MKTKIISIFAFVLFTVSSVNAQFAGGNGTAGNPYQITNRQHLILLADSVNNFLNWSQNKHFIVMENITEPVSTVIGTPDTLRAFRGNFNGNNKRINLAINITNSTAPAGLFGHCRNAEIYGVIVEGTVQGRGDVGGIAGMAVRTNFQNCINYCEVKNATPSNNYTVGGIAGNIANVNILNCINYGNISSARERAGGVAGGSWNRPNNISHSINYGNVTATQSYAGGIAAHLIGEISHCKNYGNVTTDSAAGGIVGCIADGHGVVSSSKVTYCLNSGEITARIGSGGVTGHAHENIEISFCINIGTIKGERYIGGISSGHDNQRSSFYQPDNGIIHHCINSGLIIGNRYVGGIIGECYAEVHHCLNTGVVAYSASNTLIGGVFGRFGNANIINQAKNNFSDNQMCYWGAGGTFTVYTGRAEDRITKDLVGNSLQSIFGNENWSYSDNLYPTLKGFENDDIAIIARSPAYLDAGLLYDCDRQNNVRECFTVNIENDVQWTNAFDRVLIENYTVEKDTVYLEKLGNDTLYAGIGNVRKTIPITVNKLCPKLQGEVDTIPMPVPIIVKIHKCSDTTFRFGHMNESIAGGFVIVSASELMGDDKDLFSYTISDALPITLYPGEWIDYYVTFNSTGATVGTKTAYFYETSTDLLNNKTTVHKYILTAEVVELTATPTPLNFGNITQFQPNSEYIKIENPANQEAKIKSGYLRFGTHFNLETVLDGVIIPALDSIFATVSVNSNTGGNISDTLIVITEHKYCDDTLKIPIIANVEGQPADTVKIDFGKIFKCSNYIILDSISHLCFSDVIHTLTATEIEGTDKNLFSYKFSVSLPYENGGFENLNFNVTFTSPKGTPPGIKTAYFYINNTICKINNTACKIWFVELTAEVVELTATPNPLNFGEIEQNQPYSENIKIENPADHPAKIKTGYLVKNTDFNLETILDGVIIPALDSIFATVSVNTSTVGEITDTLIVIVEYKYCDDTLRIPIRANVKERPMTDIRFYIRASKHPLTDPRKRNYRVPIFIRADRNVSNYTIEKLVVEVDRRIYYPKRVDNGEMSLHFKDTIIEMTFANVRVPTLLADKEEILLTIRGDVLLGEIDSSEIVVVSADFVEDFDEKPELIHGFITLDICIDGGARLAWYDYAPEVIVKNNPVTGSILELLCKTIERGDYSLEIVNMLGQTTETVYTWQVSASGKRIFDIEIDIQNFASGAYMIIMNTPSARYSTGFVRW